MAEAQTLPGLTDGVEKGTFDEPLDNLAWERQVMPVSILKGLYKIVIRVHRVGEPARQGLTLEGFAYKESG